MLAFASVAAADPICSLPLLGLDQISSSALKVQVLDQTLQTGALTYRYFPGPVGAARKVEVAELALSAVFHREIKLNNKIGEGSFRTVYSDPLDSKKVIKVYELGQGNNSNVNILMGIQRELLIEQLLVKLKYRVARIDQSHPELFQYGVIIQDKLEGNTFDDIYPMQFAEYPPEELKKFAPRIRELLPYDEELAKLGEDRSYPFRLIPYLDPFTGYRVGLHVIDWNATNIVLDLYGREPTFRDW